MVVCNPLSGFSALQTCWASKNSCQQRAGRSGRTRTGRVYRLVHETFYVRFYFILKHTIIQNVKIFVKLQNELDAETPPEIQRTSLENLILNTKLLRMGSPKNILGLAMDPPDLSNINKTILLLKEVRFVLFFLLIIYSRYNVIIICIS